MSPLQDRDREWSQWACRRSALFPRSPRGELEVAGDILVKALERGDVEDSHPSRASRIPPEMIEASQERGERFARPGGGEDQSILPCGDRRPAGLLGGVAALRTWFETRWPRPAASRPGHHVVPWFEAAPSRFAEWFGQPPQFSALRPRFGKIDLNRCTQFEEKEGAALAGGELSSVVKCTIDESAEDPRDALVTSLGEFDQGVGPIRR